jgi:hypothetical protein
MIPNPNSASLKAFPHAFRVPFDPNPGCVPKNTPSRDEHWHNGGRWELRELLLVYGRQQLLRVVRDWLTCAEAEKLRAESSLLHVSARHERCG